MWRVPAVLILVLLAVFSLAYGEFEKEPYLMYPGRWSSMWILWQSTSEKADLVEIGLDDAFTVATIDSSPGEANVHVAKVSGLSPNTQYQYRVTSGEEVFEGSFWTAPVQSADEVTFFGIADSQFAHCGTARSIARALNQRIEESEEPTFFLLAGDWVMWYQPCYLPGTYENLSRRGQIELLWDSFFVAHADVIAAVPAQGCLGNHDVIDLLELREVHEQYWPYPYVGAAYWSFDYGPVHVTVLDNYTDLSPGSPQYEWALRDLERASGRPWTIVQYHDPSRMELWPEFAERGVDLVVNGHWHSHQYNVIDGIPRLVMSWASYAPYSHSGAASAGCLFYEFVVRGPEMTIIARAPNGSIRQEITLGSR